MHDLLIASAFLFMLLLPCISAFRVGVEDAHE
jgi:hypothetical protein